MRRWLLFSILAFVMSCGGDDSNPPAPDAPGGGNPDGAAGTPDSAPGTPDSAPGTPDVGTAPSMDCVDYCTCMATNCPAVFPNNDACLAECATVADPSCRITHCGNAAGDPTTHCPHAAGDAVCT